MSEKARRIFVSLFFLLEGGKIKKPENGDVHYWTG